MFLYVHRLTDLQNLLLKQIDKIPVVLSPELLDVSQYPDLIPVQDTVPVTIFTSAKLSGVYLSINLTDIRYSTPDVDFPEDVSVDKQVYRAVKSFGEKHGIFSTVPIFDEVGYDIVTDYICSVFLHSIVTASGRNMGDVKVTELLANSRFLIFELGITKPQARKEFRHLPNQSSNKEIVFTMTINSQKNISR